ncbi:MAG: GNAT family N-acetyltransferase [Candidatus Falkowbacteria bacterium]
MLQNEQVIAKINQLKKGKYCDVIIEREFAGHKYQLCFLTEDCAANEQLMKLMSEWRKKHEYWFQAQFSVSVERTTAWFRKKVIATEDRLLFMIMIDGKYIGHVGLFRFDFDKATCEIDNIVRGEDQVYPGLIGDSVLALMQWGKETLGLKNYTLQTTSDNERALRLYQRLGFVETKRIPLIYQKTEEGGEWVEVPVGHNKPIERYDVFMELNKNL